nr:hypothetical protein [Chelativorans sp. EGI FJ00035]
MIAADPKHLDAEIGLVAVFVVSSHIDAPGPGRGDQHHVPAKRPILIAR